MKKNSLAQSGFTIIELVIVIVVLGILAAVALPRFTDFTASSREAVLAGLSGAIASTNTQVYAQSLIQGNQNLGNTTTVVPGIDVDDDGDSDAEDTVPTRFGYLRDNNAVAREAMKFLLQLDDASDLTAKNKIEFQIASGVINVGYDFDGDGAVNDDDCHITYAESTAVSQVPDIDYVVTNC